MNELVNKAQKCLDLVRGKGVDKAFCSLSSSITHEFNVDGGEFSLFRTLFDRKFSLTVYDHGKKGSISQNKYDDGAIAAAVDGCIASAESAAADDAWDIAPVSKNQHFTEGAPDMDTAKLFDRTKELLVAVKERHPKIILEQMIVKHVRYDSVYANTNGVEYTTLGGEYLVELMYSGHDGDATSSFFGSGVLTDSLDKPFIEMGTIEKDLTDVENQIHPQTIDGKFTGTVLLTPETFAEMIGTAISNFAGDMTLLDGTSLWKDKLGTQVADKRLTVASAPLDERVVCGERYTGEGYLSENYDIIKDGVLNSFALSQYVANKTGNARAKNSAMNLIVPAGDTPLEDIIKGIDRGIIVGRISGGEPSANGEFSMVAKNSFYIENGKIKYAVNETMMSGNLADMLNNLRVISKEVVCNGYQVMPYAAFDNVTISGK